MVRELKFGTIMHRWQNVARPNAKIELFGLKRVLDKLCPAVYAYMLQISVLSFSDRWPDMTGPQTRRATVYDEDRHDERC